MVKPFVSEQVNNDAWFKRSIHRNWLNNQGQHLLEHYKKAKVSGGFGTLNDKGQLTDHSAVTIVTARMVHCYSLASLLGVPGASQLVDHGLQALLNGALRDHEQGGWFEDEGHKGIKQAYVHAFVALAAASASMAKRPRSQELRDAIVAIINQHFWIGAEGVMAPSFDAKWNESECYRGANANMHTTEAFLALFDATGEEIWLHRAMGLVERFGHDIARSYDYRLPEHFDTNWKILTDYNADKPTDDLRPWGLTPGHFAEWGGLLLKVEAGLVASGQAAPDWLLEDAIRLFDSAMHYGWNADGKQGMVYTIGWDNQVSVANRPWWVQAEAANTAYLLMRRTDDMRFEAIYREVWDYIASMIIDSKKGGWLPEVDNYGQRTEKVYPLREDLYHAFQATLTPLLPISASLAGGLRNHSL